MQSKLSRTENSDFLRGGWFVRFFDSFFVLRPTLIFPLWTMTLTGCWLNHLVKGKWIQWSGFLSDKAGIGWQRWLLFSIAITAMYGLVYLLNQLKDIQTDKINQKLFLVAEGALNRRHLIYESLILVFIAVVSLIISKFAHLGLLVLILFAVIGILYNFTPLALKQKPWGGIIAYAAGGWMFLRLGEMAYGSGVSFFLELPYIVAFTSSCLLTNLPDKEGDIAEGKRTFVVVYGERITLGVASIGFILAAVIGVFNKDWVISIPSIITAPWMFIAYLKTDKERAIKVNKWAIFLLSLSVGIAFGFPVYILIIALYYPFARWYHYNRFGMCYPSFN